MHGGLIARLFHGIILENDVDLPPKPNSHSWCRESRRENPWPVSLLATVCPALRPTSHEACFLWQERLLFPWEPEAPEYSPSAKQPQKCVSTSTLCWDFNFLLVRVRVCDAVTRSVLGMDWSESPSSAVSYSPPIPRTPPWHSSYPLNNTNSSKWLQDEVYDRCPPCHHNCPGHPPCSFSTHQPGADTVPDSPPETDVQSWVAQNLISEHLASTRRGKLMRQSKKKSWFLTQPHLHFFTLLLLIGF